MSEKRDYPSSQPLRGRDAFDTLYKHLLQRDKSSSSATYSTASQGSSRNGSIQNISNQESTSTAGLPMSSVALPSYNYWEHQNQTAHSSGSYQGQYSLSSGFYPQTESRTSSQFQNSVFPANQNEPIQNIRNHESTSTAGVPMSTVACPSYKYYEQQNYSSMQQQSKNSESSFDQRRQQSFPNVNNPLPVVNELPAAHAFPSHQGHSWKSGLYPPPSSQIPNTVSPAHQNEPVPTSNSQVGCPMETSDPSSHFWEEPNSDYQKSVFKPYLKQSFPNANNPTSMVNESPMAESFGSYQGEDSGNESSFDQQTGSQTSSQIQNTILAAKSNLQVVYPMPMETSDPNSDFGKDPNSNYIPFMVLNDNSSTVEWVSLTGSLRFLELWTTRRSRSGDGSSSGGRSPKTPDETETSELDPSIQSCRNNLPPDDEE